MAEIQDPRVVPEARFPRETHGKASLHFSKMFFIKDERHHTLSASSRRAEGKGAQPYWKQCIVGMFPTGGGCRNLGPRAAGPPAPLRGVLFAQGHF